jgi:ABC-type multidrug transport system fused ATPase/permease subunit
VSAALTEGAHLRTTVVVAHRPSTIRRADRVAVLESGRVVQTGTWAELVAEGGAFARVLARG